MNWIWIEGKGLEFFWAESFRNLENLRQFFHLFFQFLEVGLGAIEESFLLSNFVHFLIVVCFAAIFKDLDGMNKDL